MTTPKRLSPEVLEECLRFMGATGPCNGNLPNIAEVLRGHIAALEAELELSRKGFDPWSPAEITIKALEQHISGLEKSLENARKEREQRRVVRHGFLPLLRDAVMGMNHACDTLNDMDAVDEAKDGPAMAAVGRVTVAMESIEASVHPGAALLGEHLKTKEALRACREHVRETGEEHRKALVRTRNEGLEKAAEHADYCAAYADKKSRRKSLTDDVRMAWDVAAKMARDVAAGIRAMKEPE